MLFLKTNPPLPESINPLTTRAAGINTLTAPPVPSPAVQETLKVFYSRTLKTSEGKELAVIEPVYACSEEADNRHVDGRVAEVCRLVRVDFTLGRDKQNTGISLRVEGTFSPSNSYQATSKTNTDINLFGKSSTELAELVSQKSIWITNNPSRYGDRTVFGWGRIDFTPGPDHTNASFVVRAGNSEVSTPVMPLAFYNDRRR